VSWRSIWRSGTAPIGQPLGVEKFGDISLRHEIRIEVDNLADVEEMPGKSDTLKLNLLGIFKPPMVKRRRIQRMHLDANIATPKLQYFRQASRAHVEDEQMKDVIPVGIGVGDHRGYCDRCLERYRIIKDPGDVDRAIRVDCGVGGVDE